MNVPIRDQFDGARLRANILDAYGVTERSEQLEETLEAEGEITLPANLTKVGLAALVPRLEMIVRAEGLSDDVSFDTDAFKSTFSDACDTARDILVGAGNSMPKNIVPEMYAAHCALLARDKEYQGIYANASSQYASVLKAARPQSNA